jgi:hypothetical protein
MRGVSKVMYLWPGLARLWYQGDFFALGMAIAFGVLLNLVVLTSLVRSVSPWNSWNGLGWISLVAFWTFGVWQASRHHASFRDPRQSQNHQDLFIRAQTEYLQGRWVEAQRLLEQLIRENPQDIESHLLLSSVFRRSRRTDLSRRHLRQLSDLPEATRWRFEIEREQVLLDQVSASSA